MSKAPLPVPYVVPFIDSALYNRPSQVDLGLLGH